MGDESPVERVPSLGEARVLLQRILEAPHIWKLRIFRSLVFVDRSSPRRPDFLDLLAGARNAGLEAWFVTDGWDLDERYLRALTETGSFAITVPLMGVTPSTHDAVFGQRRFDAALRALTVLATQRRTFPASPLLQTSIRLTRQNMQQAEQFVELSHGFNVDTCCILPPSYFGVSGRVPFGKALTPNELLAVSDRLAAMARAHGLLLTLPVPPAVIDHYRKKYQYRRLHTSLEYRCGCGLHTVTAMSDGDLLPCDMAVHSIPRLWTSLTSGACFDGASGRSISLEDSKGSSKLPTIPCRRIAFTPFAALAGIACVGSANPRVPSLRFPTIHLPPSVTPLNEPVSR